MAGLHTLVFATGGVVLCFDSFDLTAYILSAFVFLPSWCWHLGRDKKKTGALQQSPFSRGGCCNRSVLLKVCQSSASDVLQGRAAVSVVFCITSRPWMRVLSFSCGWHFLAGCAWCCNGSPQINIPACYSLCHLPEVLLTQRQIYPKKTR